MNDKILSQTDLIEITGYKIPSKQIQVLRKRGIEPIHRPDNTLCVLWKWVENMNEGRKIEPPRPQLRPIK
jgi:hypothetical protein